MDDVGSPGNGFDEICDLLKDDESNLPQDLELFLLNKDAASDYVYDDFGSDDRFRFNNDQQQSELPAPVLPDSGCYEIPRNPYENFNNSSRTDGNNGVLHDFDADVLQNEELMEFWSAENRQNEDDAGNLYADYLRKSGYQVDLASSDGGARNVECRHPHEGEVGDMQDSPRNDKTDEVLNQSDYLCEEVDNVVPVHQIEKLHLSCSSYRGEVESDCGSISGLRNNRDWSKELDNSLSSAQQGMSCYPFQVTQYHSISASDDLQECQQADSVNPSLEHSFHASVEDSVSSPASWQRAQYDPGGNVDTPEIDNPRVKRTASKSPIRQRICDSNSEARSFNSRNQQRGSSETGDCFYQSPGSSTRHVSRKINSRSQKHKHELTRRAGLRDSTSSRCSPASTRTRISQRSSRWDVERSRSDSASPIRRRNPEAGNKKERDISRSRSPHSGDHHRKRYESRRKSPAWSCSSRHRYRESRHSPPASSRTGRGSPGTCLFVAGFPFSTTERELERKISRYGRVRTVRVIRDKRSGISHGYGFVTLRKDEEADAAIRSLHKTYWNGRLILVEKSFRR